MYNVFEGVNTIVDVNMLLVTEVVQGCLKNLQQWCVKKPNVMALVRTLWL